MLSLEEARQKILEAIQPLSVETVSLLDSFGRFVAENIISTLALPSFDNSAMDGYAVQSKDVASASSSTPIFLRVIGRTAAGETFHGKVESGTCVRIFTGSPMPAGADAVVMQEDTRREGSDSDQVQILDAVKPWENIRFQGEDVKSESVLVNRGERLTIGRVSLLAATGKASVSVGRRAKVGLLATGNELVDPETALTPGNIYESNRVGLANCVTQAGGIPQIYPIVADSMEATTAALQRAFAENDCVVTSGGVSVGEFDFVKGAFEQLGGEMSFWKVAIRPGKPFVFGRWKEKFLFGLPGNPVSALVTFFLLVRPALLRWQGAEDCEPSLVSGILGEPLQNHGDRRHFVRVAMDNAGNVRSSGIQASHILSSLASATGLVDVPPNTSLAVGTRIPVMRWD